jgi:hypothetical protein
MAISQQLVTAGAVTPGAITPAEAAARLKHLGFLLLSPFPGHSGEANLLIALRERPSRGHFDPELIRFWRTGEDHRGHAGELTLTSRLPIRRAFSWGKLEIADRFGVRNEFVSLGGTLTADRMAGGVAVVLQSPAPILRMGGHSQAVDRIALELAAFFGRIMVPIDFQHGAESEISAASPLERYSAFIAFERARYASHEELRVEHPRQSAVLHLEAERLRRTEPASWAAGRRLLEDIGLRC